MDTRLKTVRQTHGWSQARLIVELERACRDSGLPLPSRASLKTQISRWENGHVSPSDTWARILARVYQSSPQDLGLEATLVLVPPTSVPESPSAPVLAALDDLLAEYARADNAVGSGHLLRVTGQHVGQLESFALAARGELREQSFALASRYAEFAGWLAQDAGDLLEAERWTNRALDFVEAVDDPAGRAYVLMRKSGIAGDRRDLPRALGLAAAASHSDTELPPRLRALVQRQLAISHALAGEPAETDRAIAAALEYVGTGTGSGIGNGTKDSDPLAYCTSAYIGMEAAVASMRLRRYDDAAQHLESAIDSWPAGFQRDRGLCLARRALAESMRGNLELACHAGYEAVDVAVTAGSARTRAAFEALRRRLAPHRRATVVQEFEEYFKTRLG